MHELLALPFSCLLGGTATPAYPPLRSGVVLLTASALTPDLLCSSLALPSLPHPSPAVCCDKERLNYGALFSNV